MKFHQDPQDGYQRISAYDADSVTVSGVRLRASFVLHTQRLQENVRLPRLDALRWRDLETLVDHDLQILILGTGTRQRFPASELFADIAARGIGLEVMDSPAACRTYNILAAEGRRVAAVVLLGDDSR